MLLFSCVLVASWCLLSNSTNGGTPVLRVSKAVSLQEALGVRGPWDENLPIGTILFVGRTSGDHLCLWS